ncbi:hypothetical protein N7532_001911 [Penicillium argentinense]|uniref:Subtelomeric hrmA-associated cluster protein AFUB-079030/YDR124W-like helical bundle domain-containing protein n=1 Tax=Penicillium argentinense TaxID=1131581 RepID=A0A9W9KMW2_9EURO|nr:uncharacterized protein N7532_001911 [Penicillium argentinense]KAJ5111376.1 hypothetical protein N7532_001911 [Penicillium argentinense]
MIYVDEHGQVKIASSQSIANSGNHIFTPEVTGHFMEMIGSNSQSMQLNNNPAQAPLPWGVQPSPEWIQPGQARPAEMIPCEFQSQQSRRKRHRPMAKPQPKSSSPPATPTPGRTILRVGNRNLLRQYYEKAFEEFQQLNCRAIAKSYIKLVEPRKQVHFPYNGRKVISGVSRDVGPERTKPAWWPEGVLHKEPDHLLKPARLKLLVHILCELKDSHGVTADKLREAGQDVRRTIDPPSRLQVLDEIYFVRRMEEQYLDGEIDGNTLVAVTYTQLPEALSQEGEEFFTQTHVTPVSVLDIKPEHDRDHHSLPLTTNDSATNSQGLPLSPATSDSSGPHSPGTTDFNSYTVNMGQAAMPQGSPTAHKSMPPHPHPSYIPSYYPQEFIPAQKPAGEYWPDVPALPPPSQYGY